MSTRLVEVTLFVGSGISRPEPSRVALFPDIGGTVLKNLAIDTVVDLDRIACETLLFLLAESRWPVLPMLEAAFTGHVPDAAHISCAAAHQQGATIWTPNADELIEAAGGLVVARDAMSGLSAVRPGGHRRLVKPHGTISMPETLAFRAPDVLGSLPAPLVKRLGDDCAHRTVLLCGYSARDPDLGPALVAALATARRVCWFEFSARSGELKKRLARLGATTAVLDGVVASPVPARDLVDELVGLGVPAPPASLLDELRVVVPAVVDVDGSLAKQHLAAARILAHVGEDELALERYELAVHHGSPISRAIAAGYLTVDALYRGRARKLRQVVRAVSRAPGIAAIPKVRHLASLDAALFEQEGRYRESLRVARLVLRHDRAARRLLDVAAAARKAGALDEAASCAREAVVRAHRNAGDGRMLCRALFEMSYTSRWRGQLDDANDALTEFRRVAVYGGTNWLGWLSFEEGCVATLHAELDSSAAVARKAIHHLQEARELFDSMEQPHKALQVDAAMIAALRAAGEVGQAAILEPQVWAHRVAMTRRSKFEEDALRLERGEIERAAGRLVEARRAFEAVLSSHCPVHVVLGQLGLAHAAFHDSDLASPRASPDHPAVEWATRALHNALASQFGYGILRAFAVLVACNSVPARTADTALKGSVPQLRVTDVASLASHPVVFP